MTSVVANICIETADYPPVYYPGSVIKGDVVLKMSGRMSPIRRIEVNLSGIAHAFWTQDERIGNRYYRIPYTYTEKILGVRLDNILPTRQRSVNYQAPYQVTVEDSSVQLGPGRHKFPFIICLSKNLILPTSYEYTDNHPFVSRLKGYIRYMLAVKVSATSGQNFTAVKGITIISNIDVNAPNLLRPLSNSKEKTVCCLCCASGPVSMTVSTDRSAYCSGESIRINVDTENHSSRRIVEIIASLKQTVVFYGDPEWNGLFRNWILSHLSSETYKIDKIIRTVNSSTSLQNISVPIPVIIPTIIDCSSVQVFYTLKVTLVLRRALDLNVELPIVIGTIPFRGPNTNPAPNPVNYPQHDTGTNNLSYTPISTKQVYIGFDAYTQGDLHYTPLYSYVDSSSSTR